MGWGRLGYVIGVRLIGAVLGNVFIWAQTIFYPVYKASDAARGLNPLSDQNVAGAIMMIEQIILTTLVLGWLFYRFALADERRQALVETRSTPSAPAGRPAPARRRPSDCAGGCWRRANEGRRRRLPRQRGAGGERRARRRA
jgi:putative membrane protein